MEKGDMGHVFFVADLKYLLNLQTIKNMTDLDGILV